ncbi:MAG TPA: NUDIX hydrolase [Aggregatilineaceae bacterium]|nr:NUDIX hydrolase [Aggregatilineaceae bacterium]
MNLYNLDIHQMFLVTQKALVTDADKLLILENAYAPYWELPGGLLEFDETLPSGLIREVREETGLMVAVEQLLAAWDFSESAFRVRDGRQLDAKIIGLAFQCQRIGGSIRLSTEHRQHRWATHDELRRLKFSPNSKFAIEQYLFPHFSNQ